MFVRVCSVDITDEEGLTALHLAVQGNALDVVTLLLSKGANVNAATTKGETPTHIAARHEFVDILRTLVDAGANVNAVSSVRVSWLA